MRYGLLLSVVVIVCRAFTTGRVLSNELPSDDSAAELYAKHYASCHGKDGRAKTFKAKFNQARNLTDPAWHDSVSDERVFNSIMNGRGKKMPSFGKKLSEKQIESLARYVRS